MRIVTSDVSFSSLWRSLLTLSVALAGVVVSLGLYGLFAAREEKLLETEFHLDAGKRVEAIQRVLLMRQGTVDTLAAFFSGSDFVERREFHTFSEPLADRHDGVFALAWVAQIPADRRHSYQEHVRKAGLPHYEIVERNDRGQSIPARARDAYCPILYAEPLPENQSLLGLDLEADPKCQKGMREATLTGRPVAVVLPLGGEDPTGERLLYVFKAARNGKAHGSNRPEGPLESQGFVLGIFRLSSILDNALDFFIPVGIDIYIDVNGSEQSEEVFTRLSPLHGRDKRSLHLGVPPPKAANGDLRLMQDLEVADRRWTVKCVPLPSYLDSRRTWGPIGVLMTGLLSTALLAGYLFLLTGRTRRVEQLVAERTCELRQSEQRFRRLVDNAGDAFFLHDVDGNIVDVSKRACDCLGYTREELLSMRVADVDMRFVAETDPDRYWNRKAEEYPLTLEGMHRRKDGSIFPIEVRLAPIESGGQRLMLALARDITDRKHAELELKAEQHLLRDMLDLQERDRKLVAYEIHDGLAQQLAGALYKFQSVDRFRENDPAEVRLTFDEALRLLRDAMAEARHLISGLRPPILDESGIEAAVDYLIAEQRQRGGPEIEFICDKDFIRLAPPLEGAVFRIIQECLTNACRYSRSPQVRVELTTAGDEVLVEVQDWGVGFEAAQVDEGHFGLKGIRERARLLGGSATIQTAPNQGTRICVRLPLVPLMINDSPLNASLVRDEVST